ncbi:hypothetical protein DYBT9275_02753 [Dyadobacter sp. CECT 9275]|uniref:Uncharacterized protein n=1 Tax=Dyadobacter helix TaxID=2822344 RepID=A0A916JDM2_9BACT|nr:hypothetical protein DYBT9275_02753 [Dyadobacter sp. CECT 9275]
MNQEYGCGLDSEVFECHRCKGQFNHTQGTWLPAGETEIQFMKEIEGRSLGDTRFFTWDLREPEVITSDDFTCYDCITENDVFLEL